MYIEPEGRIPGSPSVILWRVTLNKPFGGCWRTAAGCRTRGIGRAPAALQRAGWGLSQAAARLPAPRKPGSSNLHTASGEDMSAGGEGSLGTLFVPTWKQMHSLPSPFTFSKARRELTEPGIYVSTHATKGPLGAHN